jgi:hypothetical protein
MSLCNEKVTDEIAIWMQMLKMRATVMTRMQLKKTKKSLRTKKETRAVMRMKMPIHSRIVKEFLCARSKAL